VVEASADVVIVGGGLGGVAAALAAARHGRSVIVTEETDWLGGQLTAQAVPPDEHPWIEHFGCTRSYRELRNAIRAYYRAHYPLTRDARNDPFLNPGIGVVSKLCHEPRVALAVIEAMLAPYVSAGRVRILLNHDPRRATADGDRVTSVTLLDRDGGGEVVLTAPYILDATETGELLPLAGVEYVTGAESADMTGEPHAPEQPQPLNMQAISVCFAFDHDENADHTIDRPKMYDYWRAQTPPGWPGPILGWLTPDPRTHKPVEHVLAPNPDDARPHEPDGVTEAHSRDLWRYRRILARRNFVPGHYASDIVLANWPMLDYTGGPIIEVDDETARRHLEAARQLSLSVLYWLQTEAPRPDGGVGYPGLRLRADVVGTRDGLAKYPYVRESRRIKALHTIVEQEVAADVAPGPVATYDDTVGVGCYRIDLHPSTGGDNFLDISSFPFEIPLGALLPQRVRNLLPAAKNIGTTHITNGCFRLHPVEWNIGEASALLAVYCLERKAEPQEVRATSELLADFQDLLTRDGIELHWPAVGPV